MTSLPWFSRDLEGLVHPLFPGRLYVVLAPTGTGKTLFGLNLVAHLLQSSGIPILLAGTEETPRYPELLACRAVHVSYADHFYGRLTPQTTEQIKKWAEYYRTSQFLTLHPSREPTLEDLSKALQERTPSLLVIDHLHALNPEDLALPRFLEKAMRFFGDLAVQRHTTILVLAQVHRPQSRDPLYAYRIPTAMSGLGSSKIEHYADVLLGLSRKLRDDTPKDVLARLARGMLNRGESVRDYEEKNTARITVLKHRMDDEASRRSILLTVNGGKMQDRIALTGTDRGDAWEGD